jgi:monoamine oxidase
MMRSPGGWNNLDEAGADSSSVLKRLHRLQRPDRSLLDALDTCCVDAKMSDARQSLLGYVAGFHAADPSKISVQWLLAAEKNQKASSSGHRTPHGLSTAVDAMFTEARRGCEIHMNTTVRAISWRKGHAQLTLRGGGDSKIDCSSVIVTVPASVLSASNRSRSSIRFVPVLTEKEKAVAQLMTGPVVKMVLRFSKAFWRENRALRKMLFLHAFDQPFPTFWTAGANEDPLLIAWAGGPQTKILLRKRGEELLELAINSLAAAANASRSFVESSFEESWHHDWNRDPFSLGAYSYSAVGGFDASRALRLPVENTLFFAGEATRGEGKNATMEAAIESGVRAAKEVIRADR